MVKKSYAVMNMSYRDPSREEDYLLTRIQGKPSFHIPVNMVDTQKMYASEATAFICQDTLAELECDMYTKHELDTMVEDLVMEVQRHADNVFTAGPNANESITNIPDNEEKLVFDFLPIL